MIDWHTVRLRQPAPHPLPAAHTGHGQRRRAAVGRACGRCGAVGSAGAAPGSRGGGRRPPPAAGPDDEKPGAGDAHDHPLAPKTPVFVIVRHSFSWSALPGVTRGRVLCCDRQGPGASPLACPPAQAVGPMRVCIGTACLPVPGGGGALGRAGGGVPGAAQPAAAAGGRVRVRGRRWRAPRPARSGRSGADLQTGCEGERGGGMPVRSQKQDPTSLFGGKNGEQGC